MPSVNHNVINLVEAKLYDSGTKDVLSPDLCVEIPENNLDVMHRTFVVQVLWVRVEGILDHIVFLFRGDVRVNQAYIVQLCLDANFGQPFVHRGET